MPMLIAILYRYHSSCCSYHGGILSIIMVAVVMAISHQCAHMGQEVLKDVTRGGVERRLGEKVRKEVVSSSREKRS